MVIMQSRMYRQKYNISLAMVSHVFDNSDNT